MSFVNVAPQLRVHSRGRCSADRLGDQHRHLAAAAATTQVLAAAQDEVSTAIAALFGSHGQHYQAISAQVAAYQQRFALALPLRQHLRGRRSGQRNTAAERSMRSTHPFSR
ncbi:PE family protein [Mycobacterium tuberculosis]|uniref:PE family protein n=1 Tax=Mycobacterium tuberculosis TaxID=1773 RepID=UPI0032B3A272